MNDKKAQRSLALEGRLALSAVERRKKSEIICQKLLSLPELFGATAVLCYMPMPGEVDLSPLCAELSRRGVTVAYPRVEGRGLMNAWAPNEYGDFICSAWGISEPVPERSRLIEAQTLSAVLTPCVAFDASLNRLGHGGGYYDRYFLRCPEARRICAAFEAQRLPSAAHEAHDVKMHMVVTEALVYSSSL